MVLSIALAILFSSVASQQAHVQPPSVSTSPDESAVVFAGRVTTPEGRPAVGAVVVSSAGGETVTAADGSFELVLPVAPEVESVELTAFQDGGAARGPLVAQLRTALPPPGVVGFVGGLVLVHDVTCRLRWLPTFGAANGADSLVDALAVFDDGSGPKLYAAAGGVRVWDGARWADVGDFIGTANALTVFDDGSGPVLCAGGTNITIGGLPATDVATWDGTSWTKLEGSTLGSVRALAVYDDGSGPELYAGGDHGTNVARWNGASWSGLGSGLDDGSGIFVYAMAVHDDGSGAKLYVAGDFSSAGGEYAPNIACWDGSAWAGLDEGVGSPSSKVYALTTFDDGSGPKLYAGGDFTMASDTSTSRIARWDGASWTALGSGVSSAVRALTVFDDGSGAVLVAGGYFTTAGGAPASCAAQWDGSSWTALGAGLTGPLSGTGLHVRACTVLGSGVGSELFLGGTFAVAGTRPAICVARWNGADWRSVGEGLNDRVLAAAALDDGNGTALFAAGEFIAAGTAVANHIARWDGSAWSALGSGTNDDVRALAAYDDGTGTALYAGGDFAFAGGVTVLRIAKWNGASWSSVGGASNSVHALGVFDDGATEWLVAGGDFTTIGSVPASRIARWNGASWASLGSGTNNTVLAVATFDDGSGAALYAGGEFTTAGGVTVNRIARWDGAWTALGTGMDAPVRALAVFDDGSGPALFAGGNFTTAGGTPVNFIARWDGSSWSNVGGGVLGGGLTSVRALTVFDDGSGPALQVGGNFTSAGGFAANRVARWDGTAWSGLGAGVSNWVEALAVHGDALVAGGRFVVAPSGDGYLARFGCKPMLPRVVR